MSFESERGEGLQQEMPGSIYGVGKKKKEEGVSDLSQTNQGGEGEGRGVNCLNCEGRKEGTAIWRKRERRWGRHPLPGGKKRGGGGIFLSKKRTVVIMEGKIVLYLI